jgi:hypothetical protein
LTQEYPELTTFFDAEIIGSAHSFKTEKWGADERTDKDHWVRSLEQDKKEEDSWTETCGWYTEMGWTCMIRASCLLLLLLAAAPAAPL